MTTASSSSSSLALPSPVTHPSAFSSTETLSTATGTGASGNATPGDQTPDADAEDVYAAAAAGGGLRLRINRRDGLQELDSSMIRELDARVAGIPSPEGVHSELQQDLQPRQQLERKTSAKSKNGNTSKTKSDKDKDKNSSKSEKKKRLKSPLLEALKLPPLSEINIPRPEQIKFAPLHIPPHRRLQTAVVLLWALLMPISLIVFFLGMSIPLLWPVLIPYFIWAVWFDMAHERGGRPKEWARRSFIWKYFAQYYPCSIVKEADLPADRPYLFGYHPHGIIGMGAFATFATEGTHFSEYFPGIKPHLLTLDVNFKLPVYRELLMLHGVASVSKRSCVNILSQGKGSAITIVVGGAAESLYAHPGTNDLTLKKRFGFIKMAIREGADLVPVFSFGENDIYDQLANEKGSTVYKLQKQFQRIFGFTLPLFHGRGIFNYNYGLMPFRHPIVSVVGRPISVTRCAEPSEEAVQSIQQLYIDELMRIWEKYKDIYATNRTRELTLVA